MRARPLAQPASSPNAEPAGAVAPRRAEVLAAPKSSTLALVPTGEVEAAYAGIRLTDVVGALSYALDMTEGQPMGHSVRTTMIGMRIAALVGLSEEDRSALFYALLLKDLGGSSNAAQLSRLYGADDRALKQAHRLIDWTDRVDVARYALKYSQRGKSGVARGWHALKVGGQVKDARREMVVLRSDRGASIASMLALPTSTCDAIRSTEEHWDGNGMAAGLRGDAIPMLSRIVSLAQTVEVFEQAFDVSTAYDVARTRRGRWFDPLLVEILETFRDDSEFWSELRAADALSALRKYEPPSRIVYADELRLDTVAEAFAKIIDAKSPYTARHSQNVAFLASRTATELGLPRRDVRALRRAALLHDVGKLGVSSTILDKPAALSPAETLAMRGHTAGTLDILKRVARFQRFAELAASHHERLDGSGYHLGLYGTQLSMPVRILAAADVCEAMSADRPYRRATPLDGVFGRMDELVAAGQLCPVAVEALTGWFRELPAEPMDVLEDGDSTSLHGR